MGLFSLYRYRYFFFAFLFFIHTSPAIAGDFDEDGTFIFDADAAITLEFDDVSTRNNGVASDTDDNALSGNSVLKIPEDSDAHFTLTLPTEKTTYRASLWIRSGEATAALKLYYSERVDEVAALFPTGRMTSDGWVELANDHIRVDGETLIKASLAIYATDTTYVDAFELVSDGDASDLPLVSNAACTGASDANACGSGQICSWSICRNMDALFPPIPDNRDALTDYLQERIHLLFGPFIERTQDLPFADIAFDQMRSANSRWDYWNAFGTAVRLLHDVHTSTATMADLASNPQRTIAACFIEADADLSHEIVSKNASYNDILVSHAGADHNLDLKAGDRLVRIDGMHPIEWARTLTSVHWRLRSPSNHQTFAEYVSQLPSLLARYANEIEVIRCDADSLTCSDVESIDIGSLPYDGLRESIDSVRCDNRPLRHLATSPSNHTPPSSDTVYSGILNESNSEERIYGLEWESLYTTGGDDLATALQTAVDTWEDDARGVIMDHRLGNGGTMLGARILWNFSVPWHPTDYYENRQFGEDEQPSLEEGQAIYKNAVEQGWVNYAGTSLPEQNVPVALLITQDASASDWLALGMKQAADNIRIFGPYQTSGGFSTRYIFSYWSGVTYVAAVGDTYVSDGYTINGIGVEPDVVVIPTQSDLLTGKDTVFETALAWIREEIMP